MSVYVKMPNSNQCYRKKLPLVVLVNAVYGLGQVRLYYEYHIAIQTKWCAPIQKGLARTLVVAFSEVQRFS